MTSQSGAITIDCRGQAVSRLDDAIKAIMVAHKQIRRDEPGSAEHSLAAASRLIERSAELAGIDL